ncbi:MAG: hypothetical protein HY562_12135 [Ignavibacteriales bacterium]|nr:hypothetical protein [Ignavibacteriales bacterium]
MGFEATSSEDLFKWLELERNIGVRMTVFHKTGAAYVFPPSNGRILSSSGNAVVGNAIHVQSGNAVAVKLPLSNIERILLDARLILYVQGNKRYQFEPPDWEFIPSNGNLHVIHGKGIYTDLTMNRNQWVEFQIPFDLVIRFRLEDAEKPEVPSGLREYFLLLAVGALVVLVLVYSSISNR